MHNPEDYRRRKPQLINYFQKKDINEANISEYCSLVGIPLIVAYTFIAEDFDQEKDFCEDNITRLKGFYGG